MKKRTVITAVIAVFMVLSLTACGDIIGFTNGKGKIKDQFHEIEEGETMAEIVVEDYGSIYAYIFDTGNGSAADSFVKLAEEGYYNGKSIDRIIDDYLIQVDFADKGEEGLSESSNAEAEPAPLYPYRGALCASASGKGFFIVQAGTEVVEQVRELVEFDGYDVRSYLKAAYNVDITEKEFEKYLEYGGAPWLHGNYEVFGQLCAGTAVLDSIAAAAADENDCPLETIVISEIKIYEYEE